MKDSSSQIFEKLSYPAQLKRISTFETLLARATTSSCLKKFNNKSTLNLFGDIHHPDCQVKFLGGGLSGEGVQEVAPGVGSWPSVTSYLMSVARTVAPSLASSRALGAAWLGGVRLVCGC